METRTYEFEKFACTKENVKSTLEKYGVAIIPNVLSSEECEQMKSEMWNYLEHITQKFEVPIHRNKPESWRSFKDLFVKHSMLLQQFYIGQSQFNWNLRQNPSIYEVFAKLWNVKAEELLVSFDGASFHFPPETTNLGWYKGNNWLHCDQSYLRPDFECVQSWINAFDTNVGDATLTVYEGSHKHHKEFRERFNISDKDDWYKLENDEQQDFYVKEKGCKQYHIKCPAGSLVLWDSRTIHSGTEPMKGREIPNFRCVSYLCYMPRKLAKPLDIKKKIKAFEELRTTSHWAHRCKLFPKTPRTYGKELPPITPINPPIINEMGEKFIGY